VTRQPEWAGLVATALLGTDRRPFDGGPAVLLDQAAVATVQRRAGRLPQPPAALPEPAPADPRPAPPEAAVRRLVALLAAQRAGAAARGPANLTELLPQWLAAARAAGYRAPVELLPELLAAARGRSELREDAVALAGPPGRWLAERNREWAYVLRTRAADAEEDEKDGTRIWEEGLFSERVTHLTRLRRRDPAAALRLLSSTWPTERAEDRLLFLDALQERLSLADEPFLEAALSDRGRNVRATAAELLSTLPGSALAARMARRATVAVRLERGRVAVHPPTACDAGMQRDGIAPKSPTGRGERAWWLGEIVAATPLDVWVPGLAPTPAEVLRLPVADGWRDELHEAWARAAVRQGDAAWARALLEAFTRPVPAARLLLTLPPAERAAWTARFVASHGLTDAFQALTACAVPWSEELALAVLGALARAGSAGAYPWSCSGVIAAAERALPPTVAAEVERLAEESGATTSPWGETFTRVAATLRVREAMLFELSSATHGQGREELRAQPTASGSGSRAHAAEPHISRVPRP
jgi:hypothetical protein